MKRRIFSLLLVLVMLLSLCLVSCEDDEAAPSAQPSPVPPPKAIPIEYINNKLGASTTDKELVVEKTTVSSITVPEDANHEYTVYGDYFEGDVEFYSTYFDNVELNQNQYTYLVFSNVTGKSYTFTLVNHYMSYENLPADSIVDYEVYDLQSYRAWEGFVLSLEHNDDSYTHILFDMYLNKLASVKSDSYYPDMSASYSYSYYDEFDDEDYVAHIEFEGYEFEAYHFSDNLIDAPYSIKVVKEPTTSEDTPDTDDEPLFDFDEVIKDEVNGGYYTISENTYIHFDEKGNITSVQKFEDFPVDYFDRSISVLKNGNLFIQYVVVIDKNATDYDAWVNYGGSSNEQLKTNIVSYILNVTDGTVTHIADFNYFAEDEILFADNAQIKSLGITEGKNFIFEPSAINEYRTIETLYDTIAAFDDNMNIIKYYKISNDKEYEALPNGAFACYDGFSYYIADADGNKVADLPHEADIEYNSKWFISDDGVRDNKYNLIYDFTADKREVHTIYDESILFLETAIVNGNEVERYVLWTSTNTEIVIGTVEEYNQGLIFIEDYGFVVFTGKPSSGNTAIATIYSTKGENLETVNFVKDFTAYEFDIRGRRCYELVFDLAVYNETADEHGNVTGAYTEYPTEYIYIYTSVEYAK